MTAPTLTRRTMLGSLAAGAVLPALPPATPAGPANEELTNKEVGERCRAYMQSIRARFHGGFAPWLNEAQSRSTLRLLPQPVRGERTEIHISGLTPHLRVELLGFGCAQVAARSSDGRWQDLFFAGIDFTPDPTLEAKSRAEIFEPLLDWLNTELAPARRLHFRQQQNGLWHAALSREGISPAISNWHSVHVWT